MKTNTSEVKCGKCGDVVMEVTDPENIRKAMCKKCDPLKIGFIKRHRPPPKSSLVFHG